MATTNYSWNLPTVGGSEDTWGTQLNANWTALDTLLGGTGTVSVRDSFNTASITDNGTGNYSQNFSSAMQNNDFSATGGVSESGVGGQARLVLGDGYSTTVCLILSYSPTANIDYKFIAVTTHGDLA